MMRSNNLHTNKVNPYLWAKKRESDSGIFLWLSLEQHSLDTMNTMSFLWEHWLSQGQRQLIICSLSQQDEDIAKRLVNLIGLIHDIGKATPSFQTKQSFYASKDLDQQLIDRLLMSGFQDLDKLVLPSINRTKHAVAGQVILSNFGIGDDIASIVGGHHGQPINEKRDIRVQFSYPENYVQVENKKDSRHQKWTTVQKELFEWSLQTSEFYDLENVPTIQQPALIILQGLLIMADWIASNEHYFPLIPLHEEVHIDQDKRRVEGLGNWKKSEMWVSENTNNVWSLYNDRFGFDPRDVQIGLSQAIENCQQPGIIILEAPMGCGKTEGALIAAEQLAQRMGCNGIFFGLPTQATSNGIFPRINDWLKKLSLIKDNSKSIQLVHGKAALNPDFAKIRESTHHQKGVVGDESSVFVNDWFVGRKTAILDDFVVGTVDQFLMAALKQKHLALRHLGLSKKVVIIDEVHAYDAYMGQYLQQAIRWMGAYQIPVIILSATLPSRIRTSLIEQYIRGRYLSVDRDHVEYADWSTTDTYPVVTYTDGNGVRQYRGFETKPDKTINIEILDEQSLFETIDSLVADGGIVGIVVNTVRRAQDLTRELITIYSEEVVELLHSSFIATERARKEQELLSMVGKGAKRPYRKIIVGTQVIEQSLDIDFDVLITDLAPMDLLLQRAGRLHRHKDVKRANMNLSPTLYVLGVNDDYVFEEGTTHVYDEFVLFKTQYFLPSVVNLPEDISSLVQLVYSETIELNQVNQELLEILQQESERRRKSKEEKAKTYRIDRPYRPDKNSLIGWLRNIDPDQSEEGGYARVRDSSDSIEVIVTKKVNQGYGFIDEDIDISTTIDEVNVSKKLALSTLRLPHVLCTPFRIDKTIRELERFNNEHLANWQDSPWLKGSLGIIFDAKNRFSLNGFQLSYDPKIGLLFEKEGMNNGEI